MNFRLIVKYYDTGIITEQYFPGTDTPDTIINYLNNALENGAKLNYILQQKVADDLILDRDSSNYTDWGALPAWDMNY